MNKDFTGFDEMVEALEENEDMVECKECFDLFPKTDCERSEVGYVCPVCKGLRTPVAQARFVDPYDSYTQEFPEVNDYDPGTVVEYEKEPGLGDALADLIKDEYEAIDGYEVADETVQHAEIPEEEKDEILDTLDHIKEEEEEHIDELKELCPECDPEEKTTEEAPVEAEKLEEAADEEEVEETPEEDIPEEEAEDSEETEEVSDLDSAYEAALEIANETGVGQVFGYARKDTEEFVAIEPFEVDDPEAVEDDLMAVYDDVAYAYVAYPEKSLEEALFEDVQLNEGPGRFLKGLGQKIGNAVKHMSNKDSGKLIDKFFNEGYVLIFEGPKENGKLPEEHKEEYDTADQALTAALHLSKEYPKHKIWVFAKPIDESELTPREKKLASVKNGLGAVIGCFRNGTALQKKDKELADTIKKIEIDKQDLMKTTGKTAGEKRGDPRDSMGEDEPEETEDEDPALDDDEDVVDPKEKAKQALGEKKAADGYTPESYKRYEAAYNKIVAWIEAHTKPEALTPERLDGLRKQAEAKLVENPDEDPNLDDDEDTPEETTDTDEVVDETSEEATDETTDETDATDTDTEEHSEETTSEDEAEEPEEEPTTDSTDEPVEKLSEVSEEQLKKLYTAVTGRGVGDNEKWQKVLARMRAKLQELGESLDPQDYKAEDFIEEELSSEAEAIKSLKDTQATLKSAADGIKNMTSAMHEEYHKYANPAELTAMDNLRADVDKIVEQVVANLVATGYDDLDCYDSDCYMSGNDTCTITMFIGSEDTFEAGETEDLQDHLTDLVEEALAQIKLPPEIVKIQGGAMFPDNLIMDEDDKANGITRGEITVDVTFARKLM